MSPLDELEKRLESLTRAEKAQLLQWVVRDLGDSFPGIVSVPDVCGGEPCIVRTRIPVWVLEQSRRRGILRGRSAAELPDLAGRGPRQRLGLCPRTREEIDRQSSKTNGGDL